MTTARQLEAAAIWRTAEGKPLREGDRSPTRREIDEARRKMYEGVAFGDLAIQLQPQLRRTLQHYYQQVPTVTDQFTTLWTLQAIDIDEEYDIWDFNQDNLVGDTKMGDSFVKGGLPSIGRGEPYPQLGLSASGKKGRVSKRGEAFGTYWETLINQRGSSTSIDLIRTSLERFGVDAANDNEIRVAKQFVKSTGFRTAAGEPLNGSHALTANPNFSDPEQLALAINELSQIQVGGIDVLYSKYVIVTSVPNAPKIRQAIANRRIVRNPGAQTGYSWEEQVDFGAEVDVVAFKWLRDIWPSIGQGALLVPVAGPSDLPVVTRNRLAGYENPSLWVKDADSREIGGADVDPMEGDFDSDAMWTKTRHVNGASVLWGDQIGYTTGAGS